MYNSTKPIKVKVVNDTRVHVTRAATRDEWDRDDTSRTHDIRGIQVVGNEPFDHYDFKVKFDLEPGKTYYLLSVFYDTGDSFGQDENVVEHIDLYESTEMAEKSAEALTEHARRCTNGELTWSSKGKESPTFVEIYTNQGTKYQISTSWNGYFERFREARITPVSLGAKSYTL